MKSVYYVAMVTRAHRKALDALEGKITDEEAAPYIAELENVAHRESTTGFYYNKADADKTTTGASDSKYQLAAEIGKEITGAAFDTVYSEGQKRGAENQKALDEMHPAAREARLKDYEQHPDRRIIPFEKKDGWYMYECNAMNMIRIEDDIEFVSPEFCSLTIPAGEWEIIDSETGLKMNWTCDGHPTYLYVSHKLPEATLLRTLDPDYVEGKIRDTGR
jgi:putative protease